MNKEIRDAIAEETKRLDDVHFALGDILDVKASVVLVAVTFLGALTGQILSLRDLPITVKVFQGVSVLALCCVGILILRCLWVKRFELPPEPELWKKWVLQLEEHFKEREDVSDFVAGEFARQRESRTLERISLNSSLSSKKSKLLKWSFHVLGLAVILEFLCLIWLAWWHL